MCNRCIKCYDHDRMVPTENTSYIGTEGDDDDRSLIDLLNSSTTQPSPPTYRSAVTIKVNSYLANFFGFIPFGDSFI